MTSAAAAAVLPLIFSSASPITNTTAKFTYPGFGSPRQRNGLRLVACAYTAISRRGQGASDPELRRVLELASDSELYELERILFGPSYFSPLIKSITSRADVDHVMIEEDLEEREDFIAELETRFLFLAADARSTLRGWRPSYRNVLLSVRKKLGIRCSSKLSTEDLEIEIFLHLLQNYSSEELGSFPSSLEPSKTSNDQGSLEFGLNRGKVHTLDAVKELWSMIFKGGGMLTLAKIYELLARRLSGKLFVEAANYQIKKEFIKKGLSGAASRYLGFRSMMALLGPVLWGTFLADVVIQMLGTDYARILRAIYAFAQLQALWYISCKISVMVLNPN
ncbi:uncharacterized protein LOC109012098 isoform X3 [Juglans regia]|uniref:Uncharacterized protein LOC109012098 isoform X3 n=1 Tax=Juglans regia TaxID=51240 RepID=A0A6P9EHD5_JUGRE|nr:uncharacterized protein LOC109012098 isoform X3 [Juglans regia]